MGPGEEDDDEALARAIGTTSARPRKSVGVAILLAAAAAAAFFVARRPRMPQDPGYHLFADRRTLFGVPNALSVLGNAAFLLAGLLGLAFLARSPPRGLDPEAPERPGPHTAFASYRERPAYVLFFAGVLFTAFGSAYYHLAPSTARLFWDRLPMAVAFMALFASVIAERVDPYWSRVLLLPLVFVGVASVVLWKVSEDHGAGDLRPYVFVQGFPMLALPLMMLLFPPAYTASWELLVVVLLYAGAKALEQFDAQVFAALGGVVSGHALKHVVAGGACYAVLDMLKRRAPKG